MRKSPIQELDELNNDCNLGAVYEDFTGMMDEHYCIMEQLLAEMLGLDAPCACFDLNPKYFTGEYRCRVCGVRI